MEPRNFWTWGPHLGLRTDQCRSIKGAARAQGHCISHGCLWSICLAIMDPGPRGVFWLHSGALDKRVDWNGMDLSPGLSSAVLTVGLWASHFISLSLSFATCKMGMVTAPTYGAVYKLQLNAMVCMALGKALGPALGPKCTSDM